MNEFLTKMGLSEGIIETIKWWLPYLTFILVVVVFIMMIRFFRNKNKRTQ